jgi:hormone-sensitive lipase
MHWTKDIDTLIIHIHGGGWVSMSSGSHQNYTRLWANDLNIPIFSIDYRLAPKNPFPDALNDCWQVYYYLIERGGYDLGINGGKPPKKVILVGDSAGGNLVAAITIMAIQRNYRVPDGIILAYPGLNLQKSDFSPSLLLSLDDPILPYPFLQMCL